MDQLQPLLTLKDIAPLVRWTVKSCQHACKAGRFPIRFVAEHPYRFTPTDVAAFVERGEITNPLIQQPKRRTFFNSVRRAG